MSVFFVVVLLLFIKRDKMNKRVALLGASEFREKKGGVMPETKKNVIVFVPIVPGADDCCPQCQGQKGQKVEFNQQFGQYVCKCGWHCRAVPKNNGEGG